MLRQIAVLVMCLFLIACGSAPQQNDSTSDAFLKAKAAYLARDFGGAFPLMLDQAKAGNAEAQYTVGYMYYYGEGITVSKEDAVKWIRKAAENGHPRAFDALGMMR